MKYRMWSSLKPSSLWTLIGVIRKVSIYITNLIQARPVDWNGVHMMNVDR